MQVTFLFWNLMKKPLLERVGYIALNHDVDIVILAECIQESIELVSTISHMAGANFFEPFSESHKIRMLTRLKPDAIVDRFNDPIGGLTIRHLDIGPHPGLLLAAVHFPSRVNWDANDQALEATTLAQDIRRTEADSYTNRTILVGDFNMNPFDYGVVGGQALNAVMSKDIAERESRTIREREYSFFYNPMWGCFGDRTHGPPGTYYYSSAKPINHFWNIFDQVLLRPSLMHKLSDLRILDTDGEGSLVTKSGKPDVNNCSDHLPILFSLEL